MFLSEGLALGAAFCTALCSMFISEINRRIPVLKLSRWQLTAGCLMTLVIATAANGWVTLGLWEVMMLSVSGIFGIVLANTTYLGAINLVGPRVTAMLFALTSPIAVVLAYFVLGEAITLLQGAGIVLVLIGLIIAIGPRVRRAPAKMPMADNGSIITPEPVSPPLSLLGICLGIITAFGQAVSSLIARPVMASGVEPFAAMGIRSGIAVIFFWMLLALPAVRRFETPSQPRDLVYVVIAAFIGTTLGMSLLMAALRNGNVGIVSTLSSMTPIVILPMVWMRTKQMPGLNAWIGAGLAIVGTALISIA